MGCLFPKSQTLDPELSNYPIRLRGAASLNMNTKQIKDRTERKKLKRAARRKQPPRPKQTEPRGSLKPKVKKKGPGVATRK